MRQESVPFDFKIANKCIKMQLNIGDCYYTLERVGTETTSRLLTLDFQFYTYYLRLGKQMGLSIIP